MITLVLSIITLLFFFFALIKEIMEKILRVRLCALCMSVAVTWLGMFFLKSMGYAIDVVLLAILMGESITGILYRTVYSLKRKSGAASLLDLGILTVGTMGVYFLIKGVFEITALIIPFLLFLSVFIQRIKKEKPKTKLAQGLVKKLEECCR